MTIIVERKQVLRVAKCRDAQVQSETECFNALPKCFYSVKSIDELFDVKVVKY